MLNTLPHIRADLKDRATAEGKTIAKSFSTSRTHCGEEGVEVEAETDRRA
jgi:hypothetical protein